MPLELYPLPKIKPVSGAWKNTPGAKCPYIVVPLESLAGNYYIAISSIYRQVKSQSDG
jgi:hypothetical protein